MNKQERYNELVAKHEQEVEQGIVPDDAELSERVRLFYELDPERQHWKKYPVMSHYEPSDLWPER